MKTKLEHKQRMSKLGIELAESYLEKFPIDTDCDCIGAPSPNCPQCNHPGHPFQLIHNENAWEIYQTVPQFVKEKE